MSDRPFEDSPHISMQEPALQNGHGSNGPKKQFSNDALYSRADELQNLLASVLAQLIPFVHKADSERQAHQLNKPISHLSLVESHSPSDLLAILNSKGTLSLPDQGAGQHGLIKSLSSILQYSVNPSTPGFLDKLYAAPLPPGIVAELILAVLNTNVHVYQVSPVLSLIETHVTKALAGMFGFTGSRAGGINVQGGSASNTTSIVIARNTLFPETKRLGNHAAGRQLVMFTSEHGHYSIEKAAQQCGFGSNSVISVPVDPLTGTMDPKALESLVEDAKRCGKSPFYVNATAGTTVLGSFDPFPAISHVSRRHGLWMHIDGAWGGSFVFSDRLRQRALNGCELADSIAINPHKMMGVPVTCSFLLLKDLKNAHEANTLPAGYLFHENVQDGLDSDLDPESDPEHPLEQTNDVTMAPSRDNQEPTSRDRQDKQWTPPADLADLTLQCGRRGDSLKLFLSWQYYGTSGYSTKIDDAYATACHLADLVDKHPDLLLVSTNPPPSLQVCFYFAPKKTMTHSLHDDFSSHHAVSQVNGRVERNDNGIHRSTASGQKQRVGRRNSAITAQIVHALIPRGFMVDYAPALGYEVEKGSFFRVVVNISTARETVEQLLQEITRAGSTLALAEHAQGESLSQ